MPTRDRTLHVLLCCKCLPPWHWSGPSVAIAFYSYQFPSTLLRCRNGHLLKGMALLDSGIEENIFSGEEIISVYLDADQRHGLHEVCHIHRGSCVTITMQKDSTPFHKLMFIIQPQWKKISKSGGWDGGWKEEGERRAETNQQRAPGFFIVLGLGAGGWGMRNEE